MCASNERENIFLKTHPLNENDLAALREKVHNNLASLNDILTEAPEAFECETKYIEEELEIRTECLKNVLDNTLEKLRAELREKKLHTDTSAAEFAAEFHTEYQKIVTEMADHEANLAEMPLERKMVFYRTKEAATKTAIKKFHALHPKVNAD